MRIHTKVKHFDALLLNVDPLRFTHYDKIILAGEKYHFKLLNPEINKKLQPHPNTRWAVVLNNGNVPSIEYHTTLSANQRRDYRRKGIVVYPLRRFQNIIGGTIELEGNSIKLVLNGLDSSRSIEDQVKRIIKYLIEHEYILENSTDDETLTCYLNKFHFNEVELNAFFDNEELYNIIKNCYGYLDGFETSCLLSNFGCRLKDEEKRLRAIHVHRKLNRPESSCYIWVNDSSKLYVYNVTAKRNKRSYNLPGDSFKIELTLKRMFFKNSKIGLDFDLIQNIQRYGIYQKVVDAIIRPIRVERIDVMMHENLCNRSRCIS